MVTFSDMYGSKYFGVGDLNDGTPRHRIGKVVPGDIADKDGSTKRRLLVFFENVEKPLVLNRTNARKLAEAYTEDFTKWPGALVDCYDEETSLGKGVRLRPVKSDPAMNDTVRF